MCHPDTSDAAAARATVLLDHMIRFSAARECANLHFSHIEEALVNMGRSDNSARQADAMDTSDGQSPLWTDTTRVLVLRRFLSVAQSFAAAVKSVWSLKLDLHLLTQAPCCRPGGNSHRMFVQSLVALAINPKSAQLRDIIEVTISAILSTTDDLDKIASSLYQAYRERGAQTQLEVLRVLPHTSEKIKMLRKCVARAWLVGPQHSVDKVVLVSSPCLCAWLLL